MPPLPKSAPDSTPLAGVPNSGLPIRLRLFVDARGAVAKVEVLQASQFDAEAVARLKDVFLATGFVPGRSNGVDVASYLDIELSLADLT